MTGMAADLDPKSNPDGTIKYIRETLEGLKVREGELSVWFNALAKQVSLGVIKCKDVIAYNAAATANYNVAVDFYAWLRPMIDNVQTGTGLDLMPQRDVPLPQLIGSYYHVYTQGGRKVFDTGVTCNADGSFASTSPASSIVVDPPPVPAQCVVDSASSTAMPQLSAALGMVSRPRSYNHQSGEGLMIPYDPYAITSDLDGGLGAIGFGACFTRVGSLVCLTLSTIALVGIIVLTRAVTNWLSQLTGTRRDEINAHLYDQKVKQDALRAEYVADCMEQKIQAAGGAGAVDVATIQQWQKDCEEASLKVVPPSEPPYASGILAGLAGLALAGGIIGIAVVAMRRRGSRAAADDE